MSPNQENRTIEPYLFFDGRCEEAIDFYRKALGAEVEMMMRFKESPEPSHNPPGSGEKRIIILLGMQPQYGHSPPTRLYSTPTTDRPACASRPAASSPPTPSPTTTTSTCSAMVPTLSDASAASQELIRT